MFTLYRLCCALTAGLILLISADAVAQLRVNKSVIDMDSNQTLRRLELSNHGDTPIDVSIDLHKVVEPALSPSNDEITTPVSATVLRVEPSTATLIPGERLSVMIHHSPRKVSHDEAYRLLVKPTLSAPPSLAKSSVHDTSSAMNIQLNYDLLLLIRPERSQPDIQLRHTNEGMALINRGHTNAMLASVQMCDESANICHRLPRTRLYSQQSMALHYPPSYTREHTVIKTQQTLRAQTVHNVHRVLKLTSKR